ncbi:MAG: hypothetical protein JNJ54_19870 [Myxococcaceae bacterium]|nr:hypothetical protein [Myxococcaceae bacterium]
MSRWWLALLGVGALGVGVWRVVLPRAWSSPAREPVSLELEPVQEPIEPPERVAVTRGGRAFVIEKLYRYEHSGEVLSATAYDVAWTNEFFDVDVGTIWGPTREALKQRFTFQQMGRFLFWRTDSMPTEEERLDVTRHIANNHLIPAEGSTHLARAVRFIREGDVVRIKGSLVRILDEGGGVLATSSVVRDDTGAGACEIVWVDELQIGSRVFR